MPKTIAKPSVLPPPETKTEILYTVIPAKNSMLSLYVLEEITLMGDRIVSRQIVTERDTKTMTLSKLNDKIERKLR